MTKNLLINPYNNLSLTLEAEALADEEGNKFPMVGGAYRVVQDSNYTDNFGFQWNKFQQVQLDHLSGSGITDERFFKATGWTPESMQGNLVLEAGCGAGRFTSVVLKNVKDLQLHSFDFSDSVTANFKNNGPDDRLHLFQASIYEMPFAKGSFEKIFCFGVLQFTPDPEKSVDCLIEMLAPGGELVVDFFPKKGWWTKVHAKYIFRPFTSRINHVRLLSMIERNIDWLMTCYDFFAKLGLNKLVNRFLPICDIATTIPADLTKEQRRQWAILDTFNMLSPAYDKPQRMEDVKKRFLKHGLTSVEGEIVQYAGDNSVQVVRGKKPTT